MSHAQKLLMGFLETLELKGEVVPGTPSRIQRHLAPVNDAGVAFQKTMELLTGFGSAYVTPKGKRALRADVTSKFVIDRLPLKEGSADNLYQQWAAHLAEFEPAHQAKIIVDRLLNRGYEEHLAENPHEGRDQRNRSRALAALYQFKYAFDPEIDLYSLAKDWALDLGPLQHHLACRMVAKRISHPDIANAVCRGGRPVHVLGSDERFIPLPPEEDREVGPAIEARLDKERSEARREVDLLRKQIAEKESENAAMDRRIREYEASRP